MTLHRKTMCAIVVFTEKKALGKEAAHIVFFIIIPILVMAVYYDFKFFKIPNRLNYSGWIAGTVYSALTCGIGGFINSIIWIFIPILTLFILFIFNVLGAGDIKLFSLIGSFVFSKVFYIVIFSMIIAAIYGLVLVLHSFAGKIKADRRKPCFTTIHFSQFILLGTLAYLTGGVLLGI